MDKYFKRERKGSVRKAYQSHPWGETLVFPRFDEKVGDFFIKEKMGKDEK